MSHIFSQVIYDPEKVSYSAVAEVLLGETCNVLSCKLFPTPRSCIISFWKPPDVGRP